MAPRCLSTLLLLLLLLVAALHVHHVGAGFVLTPLPVEKVPVAKQLNASQAFVKTWQIRVNASENVTVIDVIQATLPCQTFITYANGSGASSSSSGGVLGEVRVTGSTDFIVQAVRVTSDTYYAGSLVVLQTYNQSTKEEFLFVEVVVFAKNKLKILENLYLEDVVVLEDVLYSKAADESQTVVTVTSSSSTVSGGESDLTLEEDKQVAASNTPSYSTRSWMVKWPSSVRPTGTQNVDLKLLLPGTASITQRDRHFSSDVQAGQIWINEINSTSNSIDRVELVVSAGVNSSQEIQVRFKANATETANASLVFYAWFHLPIRVNVTHDNTVSVTTKVDPSNDRVTITAGYGGNIFISDKNLLVNTTYATFNTKLDGSIQVELKDLVASSGVAFESTSGNITYIGAHTSSLRAKLSSSGFLCFPSSAASVTVNPSEYSDQVASLGQQSPKVSCVTKAVPARRMTRLEPNKRPTDKSAPVAQIPVEDDTKGFGAATIIGILVASVAVLTFIVYVLMKAGCFERCKSKREEVAVPVGDYSRK